MKRNNCTLKAGSFIVQFINWSDQKRPEKRPARLLPGRVQQFAADFRRAPLDVGPGGMTRASPTDWRPNFVHLPRPNNRMETRLPDERGYTAVYVANSIPPRLTHLQPPETRQAHVVALRAGADETLHVVENSPP